MHIVADSLDDLLRTVFTHLLKSKSRVKANKGENGEIFGVLLELTNPRARLSRAEGRSLAFSAIGEFLWYMTGRDDVAFMRYHVSKRYEESAETDGHVHGAYGPRIFNKDGINQLEFVINKLREHPDSRRAVIQLYDAKDTLEDFNDVPCTCTLQFVVRSGFLHMQTHMRSNDAFVGLPHDIFCFTMLQEVLASILSVKLGFYKHAVGSLHLYEPDAEEAQAFIDEGFQDFRPMPPMLSADPLEQIGRLAEIEESIRAADTKPVDLTVLDDFWADWARLLQIRATKKPEEIEKLKGAMVSEAYTTYISKRQRLKVSKELANKMELPLLNENNLGAEKR